MKSNNHKSLQERIVNEIESTYKSLANYKNKTKDRVEIIEHKLKSLKMMLAKVDDEDKKPAI